MTESIARKALQIITVSFLFFACTEAWVPVIPLKRSNFILQSSLEGGSAEDYSESEKKEMKDLIISLSFEQTDARRRKRVNDVFQEAFSRPNGMPKRFTDLFDKLLIEIGDQVQADAKKKFFEDQASQSNDLESSSGEDTVVEDASSVSEERTPEALQLWALVDMMVQTKTIVKKHNGDLGSKGTFQ